MEQRDPNLFNEIQIPNWLRKPITTGLTAAALAMPMRGQAKEISPQQPAVQTQQNVQTQKNYDATAARQIYNFLIHRVVEDPDTLITMFNQPNIDKEKIINLLIKQALLIGNLPN